MSSSEGSRQFVRNPFTDPRASDEWEWDFSALAEDLGVRAEATPTQPPAAKPPAAKPPAAPRATPPPAMPPPAAAPPASAAAATSAAASGQRAAAGGPSASPQASAGPDKDKVANTERARRFMCKIRPPLEDLAEFEDVLRTDGLAAVVAIVRKEGHPDEQEADIWTNAAWFVVLLLEKDGAKLSLDNLLSLCEVGVVPQLVVALRIFKHDVQFVCQALELFNSICERIYVAYRDLAFERYEELLKSLWKQFASALELCLDVLSRHMSDRGFCEAAFVFLALLVADTRSPADLPPDLVGLRGERIVSACVIGLRTHKSVMKIAVNATLALGIVVGDTGVVAAKVAMDLDALTILLEIAPAAGSTRSPASRTLLNAVVIAVGAITLKAFALTEGLAHRVYNDAMFSSMVDVMILALRVGLGTENRGVQDRALQILDLCCALKPAYALRAVKAGALDLEDAAGSTEVSSFVTRLRRLVHDAEAAADAAAAELLADEDAERARAAKSKAKRKKKPAASLDAAPPAVENSVGEQAPAHAPVGQGAAVEPSQSESALRRRRRAATKAARRAAAVTRARGGAAPADSSSDGDNELSVDDSPATLNSAADVAASMPMASPELDVNSSPPAEDCGSLADLFPWMSISDAAPAPAALRPAASPPPAAFEVAMPLPEHAASKPARSVTPPLRPSSPAAAADTAAAARAAPPPLPSTREVVPLERFAAQSAELACVKDDLTAVNDELSRMQLKLVLVQDELDASKCVICLTAPRCLAVLPCRHLPLCASAECAAMMGSPPHCPLCRARVADTMQLFV